MARSDDLFLTHCLGRGSEDNKDGPSVAPQELAPSTKRQVLLESKLREEHRCTRETEILTELRPLGLLTIEDPPLASPELAKLTSTCRGSHASKNSPLGVSQTRPLTSSSSTNTKKTTASIHPGLGNRPQTAKVSATSISSSSGWVSPINRRPQTARAAPFKAVSSPYLAAVPARVQSVSDAKSGPLPAGKVTHRIQSRGEVVQSALTTSAAGFPKRLDSSSVAHDVARLERKKPTSMASPTPLPGSSEMNGVYAYPSKKTAARGRGVTVRRTGGHSDHGSEGGVNVADKLLHIEQHLRQQLLQRRVYGRETNSAEDCAMSALEDNVRASRGTFTTVLARAEEVLRDHNHRTTTAAAGPSNDDDEDDDDLSTREVQRICRLMARWQLDPGEHEERKAKDHWQRKCVARVVRRFRRLQDARRAEMTRLTLAAMRIQLAGRLWLARRRAVERRLGDLRRRLAGRQFLRLVRRRVARRRSAAATQQYGGITYSPQAQAAAMVLQKCWRGRAVRKEAAWVRREESRRERQARFLSVRWEVGKSWAVQHKLIAARAEHKRDVGAMNLYVRDVEEDLDSRWERHVTMATNKVLNMPLPDGWLKQVDPRTKQPTYINRKGCYATKAHPRLAPLAYKLEEEYKTARAKMVEQQAAVQAEIYAREEQYDNWAKGVMALVEKKRIVE